MAIIVVPDFAAELEALARRMPVWVIDTPANRQVVERLWRESPGLELTLFSAAVGITPEQECAELLGTVELHHGPYSRDPPCKIIEVIGATAAPEVRAVLSTEGFAIVAEHSAGFTAERVSHEAGN